MSGSVPWQECSCLCSGMSGGGTLEKGPGVLGMPTGWGTEVAGVSQDHIYCVCYGIGVHWKKARVLAHMVCKHANKHAAYKSLCCYRDQGSTGTTHL